MGHLTLQLAKRMGERVFAIASGADGVDLSKQMGADEAVDGRGNEVVQRAPAFALDGFDATLVLVSGDNVQPTLSLVRQGGIIAFPNGVTPEPKAPDGVQLKKVDGFGNPTSFDRLNQWVSIGEFQVHIAQTFPLEDAAQAQEAMTKHYLGKIVLRVSGE